MGNMEQVGHTLEAFAAQCHDFVKAEPGPAGRQKICKLLSQVLLDEQFVSDLALGAHTYTISARVKGLAYTALDYLILDQADLG